MKFKNIIDLMSIEFKETYRFPVMEALIFMSMYFLLQIQFDFTFSIPSNHNTILFLQRINSSLERAMQFFIFLMIGYNFAVSTIYIPLIIGYRISAAIERGEFEIILSSSVSRMELLASKILLHTIVNFTILALPLALNFYLELSYYAFSLINLPLLLVSLLVQTYYIIAISSVISILLKEKWILSSITSVIFWMAFRVLAELGHLPDPISYMLPPKLTWLVLALLFGWKRIHLLTEPFIVLDALQVFNTISLSALLISAITVISFLMCRHMSFER